MVYIQFNDTQIKGSACRPIYIAYIMSKKFAKTLVCRHDYGAKLWRHKERTPNTNDHHMPPIETPHENFLRAPLCSIVPPYAQYCM